MRRQTALLGDFCGVFKYFFARANRALQSLLLLVLMAITQSTSHTPLGACRSCA